MPRLFFGCHVKSVMRPCCYAQVPLACISPCRPAACVATGPRGPPGPQGADGLAGAAGSTGPSGPSGPLGPTGQISGVVSQSLIPDTNNAYSLGSTGFAFSELYVSSGSVYVGQAGISSTGGVILLPAGSLVGGLPIGTGATGAASDVTGPSGATGQEGPTGAASDVTGPSGATGQAGPTGAASDVTGPSGATGQAGPTGAAVSGPTGPAPATVMLELQQPNAQSISTITSNILFSVDSGASNALGLSSFDVTTGVFAAPIAGLYAVSFTVLTDVNSATPGTCAFTVLQNGLSKGSVVASPYLGSMSQGTSTVLLLNAGDTVSIGMSQSGTLTSPSLDVTGSTNFLVVYSLF